MEIETLKAINEGLYPSLLTMIEVIAVITIFFAIAGIAISLIGIAWLCFEETRQSARRQMKPAPKPAEPDEYELLKVMAAPNDDLGDNLTGGLSRRAPGVTTNFIGVSQAFAVTKLETVAALSNRPPPVGSLQQTMLARGYGHSRKRSTS